MKRAAVFGMGANFLRYENEMRKDYEIVCLGDNDSDKWGGSKYKGLKILNAEQLTYENFDCVLVPTILGRMEIMNGLLDVGIPCKDIIPWFHGEGRQWKRKEVIYVDKNLCQARFDDLYFTCQESNELAVVQEVFFDNVYGYGFNANDAVVIDIGMNVGLTSLFLARLAQVKKVYGFEPFPHIFEKAMANVRMNEYYIKQKIVAKNVALGRNDKTEYFAHDSMHTLKPLDVKSGEQKDKVKIIKAGEEIKGIIEEHHGQQLIVKIDTEGQEYNIFSDFEREGIVSHVDIFMIETHLGREQEIAEILRKNGFAYFYQCDSAYTDLGMMYAVNLTHGKV